MDTKTYVLPAAIELTAYEKFDLGEELTPYEKRALDKKFTRDEEGARNRIIDRCKGIPTYAKEGDEFMVKEFYLELGSIIGAWRAARVNCQILARW